MGNHYSDPTCDKQGRTGWMLEGTGILGLYIVQQYIVLFAMDWVHSLTKAGYHPLEVGLLISILQLEQSKREVHLPTLHR